MTDLQVRVHINQPSIDCIIARARLQFLGRIVRQRPRTLLGLLHLRRNHKRLPWVEQVAKDVEHLRRTSVVAHSIGSFFDNPTGWHSIINDEATWRHIVADLFFVESICDSKQREQVGGSRHLGFVCNKCDCAFASQRALESHCRAKHGERLKIREYVDSCTCPCCGTDFRQRLRCIAHLSDRRRTKCSEWVIENCPKLPAKIITKLDETDRELRRAAQRLGRSHHIADLPAMSRLGKVTGRLNYVFS